VVGYQIGSTATTRRSGPVLGWQQPTVPISVGGDIADFERITARGESHPQEKALALVHDIWLASLEVEEDDLVRGLVATNEREMVPRRETHDWVEGIRPAWIFGARTEFGQVVFAALESIEDDQSSLGSEGHEATAR
jgi:hypothetical protein